LAQGCFGPSLSHCCDRAHKLSASMLSEKHFMQKPLAASRPFMSSCTEGLTFQYSAVANDEKKGKAQREAAMLFTVAEGHLKEGLTAQCIEAANNAMLLFKDCGDQVGAADTMSLIVNALRWSAVAVGKKPKEALGKAKEAMETFKNSGNARGVACMSLAAADTSISMASSTSELKKATQSAEEALSTFQEMGDKKMEASAQLVLGSVHFRKLAKEELVESSNSALKLFGEVGDMGGQAKALHNLALSFLIPDDFTGAVRTAKKALAVYEQLGDKRNMAYELECIAYWLIEAKMTQKALVVAKEALSIKRGLMGMNGEEVALYLVCTALAESGRKDQAIRMAKEGLSRAKMTKIDGERSSKKMALAYEVLGFTYMACEIYDQATEAIEEGINIATDTEDSRLQIELQHVLASIKLKETPTDIDGAVRAMQAIDSLAGADDADEEAMALSMIAWIHHKSGNMEDEEARTEGIEAAQNARRIYGREGLKSGEGLATLLLACLKSLDKAAGEETLQLAQEAQEMYQEAEDVLGEAIALEVISELHMFPEGYEEALTASTAIVTLYEDLEKKGATAAAKYKVANIMMKMGDTDGSADEIFAAVELAKKVNNTAVHAALLILLTQVYIEDLAALDPPASMDRPDPDYQEARLKAHKSIKEAMLLAGQAGDRQLYATACFWKAQVLAWSGRHSEGLEQVKDSEQVFEKLGDFNGQAHSLVLIGELKLSLGDKAGAKEEANKVVAMAEEFPEACKDAEEKAKALLAKMVEKKAPKGKKGKKPKKSKKSGGKTTKLVKKMVKKSGGGGGGLDLAVTKNKVLDLVKQVITDDEGADNDTPFMEAGIDSLGSVQLVTDIGKEFRMALAPSVVFDFPTVRALAEHLVDEAGGSGGGGDEMVEEWVEEEVDGEDDDDDEDESDDDDDDDVPVTAVAKVADAGAASAVAAPAAPKGLDLAVTQNKVLDLVKQVITDDEGADNDTPFMEAGIDSLGSVQLVTDIGKEFRMALAPSVVFDFPTVRELANHLVAESQG